MQNGNHNHLIPQPLIEQIIQGEVVLFLGAGANEGAISENGDPIPVRGSELGEYLRQKFFGDDLAGRSLLDIAKFVESDYDLGSELIND